MDRITVNVCDVLPTFDVVNAEFDVCVDKLQIPGLVGPGREFEIDDDEALERLL